jgi:hypothetical protein
MTAPGEIWVPVDTYLIRRPPPHPGMDRRGFLLTLTAFVLAAPLAGGTQQGPEGGGSALSRTPSQSLTWSARIRRAQLPKRSSVA